MQDAAGDKGGLRETRRLRVRDYINAVAWNADGSRLAALSNFGGTVTIWETVTWTVVSEFHRYGGAYSFNSLAFLPDGTLLTSTPVGKSPDPLFKTLAIFSLIQWNPETGQPLRYIPDLGYPPKSLVVPIGATQTFTVSRDASMVAGISGRDVLLYRTDGWSLVGQLVTPPTSKYPADFVRAVPNRPPFHPDHAACLAFSPDGRSLAVGTGFGNMHLFELPGGTLRLSFSVFAADWGAGCDAVDFSPDGRLLATGSHVAIGQPADGWTRLWRVTDGSLVERLFGGAGSVRTISWSGKRNLLAAGDDRVLLVWRFDPPDSPARLVAKIDEVTFSTAFSPRGVLAAAHANNVSIYE